MTREERTKKWNENFKNWANLSENDDLYMVIGDTYEIKDELKKKGAKYNRETGWTFKEPKSEYKTVRLTLNDIAYTDEYGKYHYRPEIEDAVRKIQKENTHYEETGEYLGEVGETISVGDLRCVKVYQYSGAYGTVNVYTFKDPNNNTVVWSTSKYIDGIDDKDSRYILVGKIKALKEYKGDKQTILTRCKVEVYK